jgi:hypothetical protein
MAVAAVGVAGGENRSFCGARKRRNVEFSVRQLHFTDGARVDYVQYYADLVGSPIARGRRRKALLYKGLMVAARDRVSLQFVAFGKLNVAEIGNSTDT